MADDIKAFLDANPAPKAEAVPVPKPRPDSAPSLKSAPPAEQPAMKPDVAGCLKSEPKKTRSLCHNNI